MRHDEFVGLSFWLNWVMLILLVVGIVVLVVTYALMAPSAPPREAGQHSRDHPLHALRFYLGLVAGIDVMVMLPLFFDRLDGERSWVYWIFVVVMLLVTTVVSIGHLQQRDRWRESSTGA